MSSTSRLRRNIESLQGFDCSCIDSDSRDAITLVQVLGGTLEEARAGEISWPDRELVGKWLDRNGKLVPASCSGLCRQLETRLTFSFLPGLSWPGREAVNAVNAGARPRPGATAATAGAIMATSRRNLVGLVPPLDKSTEEALAAAGSAASTGLGTEAFGGGSANAGQVLRSIGRTALEDGNYSSTDDEGIARDGFSPGLGSTDVLPSVLEQDTVDVNSLEEADDDFLLCPTPQGIKSYCIIHRTSSRIRTYFRLFLQEQRPYALGSAVPAPSTPTPIGTGGGGGNTGIATGGSSSGVASGVVAATTGVNSGGGGGGIETLKAFLTSGGTGVGSGGSGGGGGGGGGGAAGAGAGGVSGLGGADLRLGRFLLSSKRYRSTRSRSTSFIWSNNGVWKDKQALAKVSTQPYGKSAADGILNSPSLLGTHGRSPPANSPTPSIAASAYSGTGSTAQSPPIGGRVVAGSPGRDGGSDGKSRSPTLSTSSGSGSGGGGGGGEGDQAIDATVGSTSWAIVVRVQSEGEAKLLTATAIVSDPSFVGSICAGSSSSSSKDSSAGEQTVEAALAEGLRAWDRTGVAPAGMIVLRSKQPKWSAWQGCHTLDFDRGEERVREPSRKNVGMVDAAGQQGTKGRPRKGSSEQGVSGGSGSRGSAGDDAEADAVRALPPILQVGKISEDQFSLDFRWPLSPLQAFVVAMSIFDG